MRRIGLLVVLILSCAMAAAAQAPNTISTVAGGGPNAATATSAYLPGAYGIVRDAVTGNTYISLEYYSIVYKVDSSGNVTPYAGNGVGGFSGDGSAAASAQLNFPSGLAVDASGNLFIADASNNRIRRVDVNSHVITTVAGSGNQYNGLGFFGGLSGDGSPATGALMNFPRGVAVDQNGNLFIADTNNNRIRMVDNSPDHIITTYAGAGGGCGGQTDAIGDGCPAVEGTLVAPLSVTIHSSGDLYIADSGENLARKVDNTANHIITTYAGSGTGCAGQTDTVGDGCPAIQAALNSPSGVSVDASEKVFISDTNHQRIRQVDTTTNHIITTVAGNGSLCSSLTAAPANCGNGGAATGALLNSPMGVFVDGLENILYADFGSNRFRLVSAGATPIISDYAGGGAGGDGGAATAAVMGLPYVVNADSAGDLFLVDNGGFRIRKVNAATQDITNYAGNGIAGAPGAANGDGGLATQANITSLAVYGMTLDSSGNLYFTDASNLVVRRVDAQTGLVTLVAGTYGQQCTSGNCGDGGPATSATFIFPDGVAVDASGNVYIADAANNRIRVVSMDGAVPGNISNFAGTGQAGPPSNGVALTATLNSPAGMVFDANGNLYFADGGNNVIRKIDTSGNISTVAFNGLPTFGGDGGSALSASMFGPGAVALDAAGNMFVGGGFDNVVRRIDAQAQTVITVAGDINNLDGGFNGDGGLAPQSLLSNFGVAVVTNPTTKVNTLYIADPGNNRTRKVVLAPTAVVDSSLLMPFGPVLAGASSNPGEVTITNNGLDDLIVTNVSVPAGFTLSNDCQIPGAAPTPVAPGGGECLLEVAFTPPVGTAGGTLFSGNLTFNTNDPANPSFSFPLSGSVPAQPAVQLTVTLAGTGSGTVDSTVPGLGPTSGVPTFIICPTQACAVDYAVGQQVTLVALGNAGSALTGWTVNGSTTTCPGVTPTCAVTMSAAQNVTANFGPSSITVSAMGNGSGTITITPGGPTCTVTNGAITSGPCTADFGENAQLTMTATASGNSTFSGWLGFCGLLGINTSGTGPCTVQSSISGIAALNGAVVTAVFSGPAQTFGQGDVFVGTIDGMIFEYKPNGTLVQVLNSGNLGGVIAGMNFDTSGNLYAANPDTTAVTGGTVEFFGNNGTGPTTFGTTPYNSNPLGVLVAPTGNIFVGQSSGQNSLLEMSSAGAVTSTFFPAYDTAGIGYIELLDDGGRVLYTSAAAGSSQFGTVKNFDIANNAQNPDFATNLPGGPAFAIRELSDKSVLVANTTKIVHLDPNGNILTTPSLTPPGVGIFYALNLNPDGQSFWTGDALSGKVYQVQISTGNVLATINTGLGFNSSALSFNTIFGIAVFGQPQSGGADVAVAMSAAPNPVAQNSNLTYTITVTNNGPLSATNVTATDVFPAGVTFVSATPSRGSCSGTTTVTCNLGTMSNAANATITIVVTPTQTGPLSNTVNVTSTVPDPNPANNSATAAVAVTGTGTFTFQVVLEGVAYGTVTDNSVPQQINCTDAGGQGTTGTCNTTYASGKTVTLTETPSPGSVFAAWGGTIGDTQCPATSTTCVVTVNQNEQITAMFTNGTGNFTLNVGPGTGSTGGGTVTGSIGGTGTIIDCVLNGTGTPTGTCSQSILSGSIDILTAEPNDTSNFAGWTGNCIVFNTIKCAVQMGSNQTIGAIFTAQQNAFTVMISGLGSLTSTSNPTVASEINCANPQPPSVCSTNFVSGTQVTLTATPATGYSFTNWTAGPCNGAPTNPCVFTVSTSTPATATASFTVNTYLLTAVRAGVAGGTITSNMVNAQGGSISCGPAAGISGCSVIATYNTQVILTETPPSGSSFSGWSATPTSCNVSGNTCTFNMPAAPETVTGTFTTGSGSLTITPSTLPNGSIGGAYGQMLQVSGGTPPYNFSISAGTLPAGLKLGATSGSIGGVPTGPTGATPFTVQVTDSSSPTPLMATATFTVTIGAADTSNDAELNGNYAFVFSGFNDSDGTTVVVAASFMADGKGNITNGIEDADGSTGGQPTQTVAGTYTLGADNRGTMALTTQSGTAIIAFAAGDIQSGVATKARFIRFDDVSGTNGHTGSGVILKQDPTAFTLSSIKGSYAFGESGSNTSNGNPQSGVGFVNADGNGNFTPAGLVDFNNAGAIVSSAALTGTYATTTESASNGRFTGSLTTTGVAGTVSDILYVISANQVAFISIDPTQNTIYSGISQLQVPPAGGFGLGSLSGNAIVAGQGKRPDGTSVVLIGNAALDGKGNFTLAFDQNKAGTLLTSTAIGTYTVASNGRALLTFTTGGFSPAIVYLDGMNQGFFGATDNAASEGFIEPGGNNFSNASLSGNYFLGSLDPTAPQSSNSSGVASFDGIGTLQTTTDETNPIGNLEGDKQVSTPYSVASNGRLTFTATKPVVGYVASGCEAEVITTSGANPGIASFECQTTQASAEALTVTLAGTGSGTVTDGSGAINCPTTCMANFPSGTQITLTAMPADGSTFTGWGGATCEGTSTCTFTITAVTAVTANFNASTNNFTLTVSEAGTGTGTVTSAPAGISCPDGCSASFASGAMVTLTAVAGTNSTFAGWSGGGCTGIGTCVVTLTAATTVTATFNTSTGATVRVAPTSLTFNSQTVGTTSAALTVTVTNTGTATVTFTGFTITGANSGDFAVPLPNSQAMCSPLQGTLAGGASCTINVLFTPTATGTRTATLNIADNAAGSPQTVTLTGTGTNSPVTIGVASGSSSSVNTTPGGSAVFGLVLNAIPGTTGTVQLGCTSSSKDITCNIVPSSIVLNGKAINVAIVVETFCKGSVPGFGPMPGSGLGTGLGLMLATLLLAGAMWAFKKQPRWALSFGVLIIVAVGLSACSNLAKSPGGTATQPGSYPLVVTATAPNGATSSVNLTLVVQ
jgi:uncharacterized repeat protein (TIGR01451 family)